MEEHELGSIIEFNLIKQVESIREMDDEALGRETRRCIKVLEGHYGSQDNFPEYLHSDRAGSLLDDLIENGSYGGDVWRSLEVGRDEVDRAYNLLRAALVRHYTAELQNAAELQKQRG